MNHSVRRLVFLWSAFILVISTFLTPVASAALQDKSKGQASPSSAVNKIDDKVYQEFEDRDEVSLIVILKEQIEADKVSMEAKKQAANKKLLPQEKKAYSPVRSFNRIKSKCTSNTRETT